MDAFIKSKLAEILFTLSKRQRKDLAYFIKIPSLHLKNYEVDMCKYMISQIEKGKPENFNKLAIINASKAESNLLEQNWNYATSNLLKVIYRFIAFQAIEPDQMPHGYTHLNIFREKGLTKNYSAHSKKLFKNLQSEEQINNHHYYHEFLLWGLKLDDTRHHRKNSTEFKHYQDSLDKFYLENQLRIACEVVSRGEIFNIKKLGHQESVTALDLLDSSSISIKIYYFIYKMLTTSSESISYYLKVKKILNRKCKHFSTYDLKTIYEYLLNFCIFNLNAGNKECAIEYLIHIKALEDKNLLLEGDSITPQKYKNTITAGLISEETEWTENFIHRYKDNIKIKQKDNILHYNLGKLEFHKSNFEKAQEYLVQFQPFDLYYKIGYEKLLLKIFYERQDFVAIKKRIKGFINFINSKDDLPEKTRTLLLNFIKHLRAMIKGKEINSDELIGKVPFTDYLWFQKNGGN